MGDWSWQKWAIFAVPFALLALGGLAWLLLRKTLRTRNRMERQLRDDPDINEWLVVFNWSRKVLYVPTILASLLAAALMYLKQWGVLPTLNGELVGGVWLAVFFLNFLVDEYELSIKVLLIIILCAIVLGLWLTLLDWLQPFLRVFTRLDIAISGTGYVVISAIFLLAIAISWLKGLFYYVAITPNYMNIQVGPTETGEQVSREEFSTRVDTGDFLERLLGFGRIMVTFADQRRQPMMLLVGKIGKRAARLESIRGKLAVDRYTPGRKDDAENGGASA